MLFKRFGCLLLAALLCMGCAASAEETENAAFILAGYDNTQYRDWLNNEFFARMEEKTGVHFIYRQYNDEAKWKVEKAAMAESGADLPDILFKADLTGAECIALREKGVLIDLKPYLQEYCPHLWAILEENPDYLAAITLPDGSIAALPFLSLPPVQNYIWINREWLNTLRLDMPTTAQELVDVLTAIQTRDPNRNGKADEIPMGFLGPFDLKFLAHAFGLICNDYNIFVDENQQVKFMPLEDNFRLFVTWCRDLYETGLLDKNGFTITDQMRTVTDSNATATYGAIITNMAAELFSVSWAENYEILMPLSYNGTQVYRDFSGAVIRGTFAITSACREPEKMLQWVDYLYTEEGAVLASIGQEDMDYLVDGDGTWRFVETVQNHYDLFRANTLIEGGAVYPGVLAQDFQRRMSGSTMVQNILSQQTAFDEFVKLPFPYYTLTEEQENKITPMQNQIGYYVDMKIARWVLGEEEISDESFAAFEQTLNEMGVQDFIDFWQDVLEQL